MHYSLNIYPENGHYEADHFNAPRRSDDHDGARILSYKWGRLKLMVGTAHAAAATAECPNVPQSYAAGPA